MLIGNVNQTLSLIDTTTNFYRTTTSIDIHRTQYLLLSKYRGRILSENFNYFLEIETNLCLSVSLWGAASPKPLRISGSFAMPVSSVKSFALCDEGCMKLAVISVLEQAPKP